jgi:sulfate transporter 4
MNHLAVDQMRARGAGESTPSGVLSPRSPKPGATSGELGGPNFVRQASDEFRDIEGNKLFEMVDEGSFRMNEGGKGFTDKAVKDYKWLNLTPIPTCTVEKSQEVLATVTKNTKLGMHEVSFREQKLPSLAVIVSWIKAMFFSFFRITVWFPKLTKDQVYSDCIAGLTVGVMLIPQSMSYADIAGLQYIYGMYSGLMPTLVYAFMGTSNQLAVGPVAMVSLLVNAGLEGQLDNLPQCNIAGMKQNEACPEEYAKLAIILSLLVGIIQFGAGMCKAGFLVAFLGHPVVSGFTSGAAVIIGLSQMKYVVGYDIPKSQYVNDTLSNLFGSLKDTNYITCIFGVIWFTILFSLNTAAKKYPKNKVLKLVKPLGPLIMCIAGILIMEFSDLNAKMSEVDRYYAREDAATHRRLGGVSNTSTPKEHFVVGEIPTGFPPWSADWSTANFGKLFLAAVGISIIGFMESISIAKALASKHQYKLIPGQELLAVGGANIIGACFSCYPVTGSFSRSAVNDSVGAQTPLSGMVTSGIMLLTLTCLTPLFKMLPKFCLAAIVISSVVNLFAWREAMHLWKVKKSDFILWMTAFLGTLFLGVMIGLGTAIMLSISIVIYEAVFPQIGILWNIAGTKYFRNIKQPEMGVFIPGILVLRLGGSLYFANVTYVRDQIFEHLEVFSKKITSVKYIVLDMTPVTTIDSSSIHALQDMLIELAQRDIQLVFANCGNRIVRTMQFAGFQQHVGAEWFLPETHLAVKYCIRHVAKIKKEVGELKRSLSNEISDDGESKPEDDKPIKFNKLATLGDTSDLQGWNAKAEEKV